MPRLRTQSLQARLLTAMLVVVGLFALVGGSMLFAMSYRHAVEDNRTTLAELVTSVQRTAAIGAFADDAVLIKEVADGLISSPLVGEVRVETAKGVVTAGSAQPSGAEPIVMDLASPFDASERVGRLIITPDDGVVRARALRHAATVSALQMLQVVITGLLLHGLVRRMVTRPLQRLAGDMGRIQPGTSDRIGLIAGHMDDEIGLLRRGGNQLLDQAQHALEGERDLRAEVERMGAQYRRVFHTNSAGIFVLDAHGRLIDCNPTVARLLGLDGVTPAAGIDFFALAFKDVGCVQQLVRRATERRRAMAGDVELRSARSPATWVHCLLSVHEHPSADGIHTEQLIEGVMYDVTSRLQAEAAVRHRADHDALTGLLNRAALQHRIDSAGLTQLAVLFVDLDGFKRINDSWGHAAGDETLRLCAERIAACVRRETDWIARVGGDEFMIVMPGVQPDSDVLTHTAFALVHALAQPMQLTDVPQSQQVAASVGMACMPSHGLVWDDVARAADQAMYAVKHHGKAAAVMAWPCGGLVPGLDDGDPAAAPLAATVAA